MPTPPRRVVTLRISEELFARLVAAAAHRGQTVNTLVTRAVERALPRVVERGKGAGAG